SLRLLLSSVIRFGYLVCKQHSAWLNLGSAMLRTIQPQLRLAQAPAHQQAQGSSRWLRAAPGGSRLSSLVHSSVCAQLCWVSYVCLFRTLPPSHTLLTPPDVAESYLFEGLAPFDNSFAIDVDPAQNSQRRIGFVERYGLDLVGSRM